MNNKLIAFLLPGFLALLNSPAAEIGPYVATQDPTNVTATSAALVGLVNPCCFQNMCPPPGTLVS